MQEKQFAFIPWWVVPVMVRSGLKTEELLSFERIRPLLSTEDLTSLAALSHCAHFFAGHGARDDTTSWIDRWLASTSNACSKSAIADIAALASSQDVQDETLRRLTVDPSTVTTSPLREAVGPSDTFVVSLMGDFGVAIVLRMGYTLSDHSKNSINLLRCMVKKLYVYEDYHSLVSRPVGQAYIESLMH